MTANSSGTPCAVASAAARRAMYIDFRGVRGSPPALLGQLTEQRFEQVVFDMDYADAALAKDLRVNALEAEVGALLERARDEERLVFGFAPRTLEILAQYRAAVSDLGLVYRDGQQLGAAWCARAGKSERAAGSLSALLRSIGATRPRHLDSKATTKSLRDVGSMLRARGSYDALTPVAKAKWTNLLQQSRAHCEGLRMLTVALAE